MSVCVSVCLLLCARHTSVFLVHPATNPLNAIRPRVVSRDVTPVSSTAGHGRWLSMSPVVSPDTMTSVRSQQHRCLCVVRVIDVGRAGPARCDVLIDVTTAYLRNHSRHCSLHAPNVT